LHLPEGWHRETGWLNLFEAACAPPPPSSLTSSPGHRTRMASPALSPLTPPQTSGQAAGPVSGSKITPRPAHTRSHLGSPSQNRSPAFTRWIEA
jgi:hypothetical protein